MNVTDSRWAGPSVSLYIERSEVQLLSTMISVIFLLVAMVVAGWRWKKGGWLRYLPLLMGICLVAPGYLGWLGPWNGMQGAAIPLVNGLVFQVVLWINVFLHR